MTRLSRWILAAMTVASTLPIGASAADAASRELVADASRELEIAQLKLRRYDLYEYPLALRKLESQIKLTEAELAVWRRRVVEYEQFDKFVGSAPVLITLDDARLTVLQLETSLTDLVDEKLLLERSRKDQYRLLRLEVESAARRLTLVRKSSRD